MTWSSNPAPYSPPPPRGNLIWAAVDLDGTIAEPVWEPSNPTDDIGAPIERNVRKLIDLADAGYKIIIHTARPWTSLEAIEGWLRHHEIPFKQIECSKILAAKYVDDRAIHAEEDSWL